MSRILICAMLVTVLSGGTGAAMVTPTGLAAQGGLAAQPSLAAQPGSDDPGDQPAMPARMFGWPLPGRPTVVRAFQAPVLPFGPGHRGVDLATTPGAPVLAAGAGTVVFAGTVAGRGVVSVDHPGGLRTTYEPVTPTVTAGDLVARGEQIGTVELGHPGCTAPACLHWGVRREAVRRSPEHDRDYLDPLLLIATPRVRLLPTTSPACQALVPTP